MFLKHIYKVIFCYFILITISFAEIVKSIEVTGNDRISKDTILMFSEVSKGVNLNNEVYDKQRFKLFLL